MKYKLPIGYAGLGEFADYGSSTVKSLVGKPQFQSRKEKSKEISSSPWRLRTLSPDLLKTMAISATSTTPAMKGAFSFREEFGKDAAAPSSVEVEAAKREIEALHIAQVEGLQAQGRVGEAQAILNSSPLDAATNQIQASRAQEQADREKRDLLIAADNKRNQLISYGLTGAVALGILFVVLKK